MFKAIYMHTKPLKHTKNMQILTNYIKTNNISEISYKCFKNSLKDKCSGTLLFTEKVTFEMI